MDACHDIARRMKKTSILDIITSNKAVSGKWQDEQIEKQSFLDSSGADDSHAYA